MHGKDVVLFECIQHGQVVHPVDVRHIELLTDDVGHGGLVSVAIQELYHWGLHHTKLNWLLHARQCMQCCIASSVYGFGVQVAHERSSVELQAVCMEVAGDCLPNVVVSLPCLHLLCSAATCSHWNTIMKA